MRTPTLANWLLARLLPASQAETIAGDLEEQFAADRSRLWFWRQAMNAIIIHSVQDVRCSKLMAVAAVVVGWVVIMAFNGMVVNTILLPLSREYPGIGLFLTSISGMAGGYAVVRLGRRFSMVLPLVLSMWAWTFMWFTLAVAGITGLRMQRPSDFAIALAVQLVLLPLAMLLGGVSAAPRRQMS